MDHARQKTVHRRRSRAIVSKKTRKRVGEKDLLLFSQWEAITPLLVRKTVRERAKKIYYTIQPMGGDHAIISKKTRKQAGEK